MPAGPSQTARLLFRWYQGDRKALESLLARDLPWIRAHVRSRLGPVLRERAETNDYVQDVVYEVLTYGPRFVVSDRRKFRALLARIVENCVRDKVDWFEARRRSVDREQLLPNESILDLDNSSLLASAPSKLAEERERECWVRIALELLSVEDRRVIMMREWEGLPFVEIGRKMGLTEGGARMRFQRALPKLARKVEHIRNGGLAEVLEDKAG